MPHNRIPRHIVESRTAAIGLGRERVAAAATVDGERDLIGGDRESDGERKDRQAA